MEQKKWEIALISEVRAKEQGVIWLGEDNEQVAVIHSQRSGIILRGDTLKAWVEEGQAKSFSERTTTIDVLNMRLIAVYQPLWSNGLEGIDTYRQYLDDEIARTPSSKILIIRGDHNAHVGQEEASNTNGRYGLLNPTTDAGADLLDWCSAHNLQWVNSFYNMRKRGTWFNCSHRRWYELDGFCVRQGDRHRVVRKMEVIEELTLSDHKPVLLHIFFPVLELYINVNLLCMKYYCVAMQHALYNYSHQQCFWKRKISRLYGFFLHEKKVISVKASDR